MWEIGDWVMQSKPRKHQKGIAGTIERIQGLNFQWCYVKWDTGRHTWTDRCNLRKASVEVTE